MDKLNLKADVRKVVGRKVSKLRQEGLLPANIFGKKVKSQAIAVKLDDFLTVYKKAGETSLITLTVGTDDKAVLVANVQVSPITDKPIHVDFHQVDLKEKVTADVPIEMTGESPAEKLSVGTVVQYIDEIEVEALPTDLPDKLVVNISKLAEVDQAIYVKDLDLDTKKVEVKVSPDEIVIKVEPPQKEEVVAPPPAAETPVEGETPVVPVEGETPAAPAEGDKKPEEKK
ncbi:MAG: 50S ribosomal protein L25 [Candidatus Microgenomates bacterium]|jgi:large subunit ribosomal protein L25